jgi:hypothetical protein
MPPMVVAHKNRARALYLALPGPPPGGPGGPTRSAPGAGSTGCLSATSRHQPTGRNGYTRASVRRERSAECGVR